MALVLLNPGENPLGQFDALDSIVSTVKGGEVLTFGTVTLASGDKSAADSADGYQAGGLTRVVLTNAVTASSKPLFLCDDGLLNYGTLFGSVVGGTVGQQVNGPNTYTGAVLGPATALGSGKLTAWDKPGLYGVTLDACDTTVATGLQPTNTAGLTAGSPLYSTVAASVTATRLLGQLSPTQSNSDPLCGYFAEFRSKGSLVTTPNRLVSALNSPSTVVGGVLPNQLFMAVFHFAPNS